MEYGSSLWIICWVTTWFLAGCGESSPSLTTPSLTTPSLTTPSESSVAASESPDGTLLTNSVGIDLKLIPAGTFTMGDNTEEHPLHQVTLTKDFYIGVYEVTQVQYEQVVGGNPSHFREANNPVEKVSWNDAVAFCKKLSALPAEQSAGRVYRLPTEAEWEYACRAGTTTEFSFGDDENQLEDYAWYLFNAKDTAHPVGQKKPNAWGLYDMHGNVLEWCSDRQKKYPEGAVTDPEGGSSDPFRILRGGGWLSVEAFCGSAHRTSLTQTSQIYLGGFRLALSSPSVQSP